MILVLKHIDIEGPGTAGEFFSKLGFELKIIDMHKNHQLPTTLDGVEAVMALGGPMNVYEEDKHPFLIKENLFIQNVLKAGIPYLGFCLGSQLLAKAAGVPVQRSPEKEIGFYKVELTEEGRNDPLFKGLAPELSVFQWHEDMVSPAGVKILALSDGCPCQAVKIGSKAYGLQFHVEVTGQDIERWAGAYFPSDICIEKRRQMSEDYLHHKKSFDIAAAGIYENFLKIINNQNDQECE
jgi:GMP synthase-like glutamine amidotransferase